MGILRRAACLRRRGTTGSIGMRDGLPPKSGWFGHAFLGLSPRFSLPQDRPKRYRVSQKESAVTDPNEGRVLGRAPSGWGRALAKPQFRRNASAGRQAGLARRLSPAAARRAGRSQSRCGRAGAGAAEAPGRLERRSKRQGSPQPCGDPALRLWAWDRAGAIARVFRRKAPRRHP